MDEVKCRIVAWRAVCAWSILGMLAHPAGPFAGELEPRAWKVERDLAWEWSEGRFWRFAPEPPLDARYRVLAGGDFRLRAILGGRSEAVVLWLPHLEGQSRAAELAVRSLSASGLEVAAILPPSRALGAEPTAGDWLGLLEERVRAGRAAVREFGEGRACRVVVGMSLGALAALPVAALEEEVDGLVLMLAAGDLASVAGRLSSLDDRFSALSLDPLDVEAARRAERLEPLAWTPDLPPRSILLIDARFDAVVPAASSDRLWEHLGRPRRIRYPTGHFSFGYALPWALDAVAEHARSVCAGKGVD